jgi:membrane dipeptidase
MVLDLGDVWDFHTDVRLLVSDVRDRDKYEQQLDLATCRRLGGVFSATGRLADAPREEQWALLDSQVATIQSLAGLPVVRTIADLAGAGRQVLHAEGVYFIKAEADLADLERLWEMGFRSLAPLYNEDNALGGGARGDAARGLTDLGRRVVERLWRMGFLVDIAHSNHRTQRDLIDLGLAVGRPVHFSHGFLDEPVLELFGQRGLPRPQAERLARTGGLIGLSPHPGFVGYFRRYLEEIDFLARAAPDNVVLGSDFTGITTPPVTFPELPSAADLPAFAQRLADRHGEEFARNFCGRSLRRMLEQSLPAR